MSLHFASNSLMELASALYQLLGFQLARQFLIFREERGIFFFQLSVLASSSGQTPPSFR
jgi:hypothetical protein